ARNRGHGGWGHIGQLRNPKMLEIKTLNYKPKKKAATDLKDHHGSEIKKSVRIRGDPWQKPYALTLDPIFSPLTTRRMFPCWFRLNTMMGRLLSLHKLIAVESITLSPSLRTSMYVMSVNFFASFTFMGSAS